MVKLNKNSEIQQKQEKKTSVKINYKDNEEIKTGCVRVSDTLKNDTECYYPDPVFSFIIKVNPTNINEAINKGYINELAFYYILKSQFIHSRISKIDRPKQRISKLTGLSINTISKYIDKLAFLGYLKADRNGWSISTYKKIKPDRIVICEPITLYNVKDALYLKILEKKGIGQCTFDSIETFEKGKQLPNKNINLKLTRLDPKNKQRVALIESVLPYIINKQVKGLPAIKELDTTSYMPYLSMKYTARILNISYVSAFNLIHRLIDKGILKQHFKGSEFICRGGDPSLLDDLYNHKYFQNGATYSIEPARYDFLVNPIIQKPMTLKRYKRLKKNPKISKFIDDLNHDQKVLNRINLMLTA